MGRPLESEACDAIATALVAGATPGKPAPLHIEQAILDVICEAYARGEKLENLETSHLVFGLPTVTFDPPAQTQHASPLGKRVDDVHLRADLPLEDFPFDSGAQIAEEGATVALAQLELRRVALQREDLDRPG